MSRLREGPLIRVARAPRGRRRGILTFGERALPCALGAAGIAAVKREGDGATPLGAWPMRAVFYRPDRVRRPLSRLPVRALNPHDGWCDAPGDRNYNRLVALPYPASAERLWRADPLYDLVVVLGYNDRPRARGRGSAIFMHIARPGFTPTVGCLALREADLRAILFLAKAGTPVTILG